MDTDSIRKFVSLTRQKKELEGQLSPIKRELDALQEKIQGEFAKEGVKNFSIDGMTVYVSKQTWAQYDDREAAILALKESGHSEYLATTFNAQSVSALIREILGDDADEAEVKGEKLIDRLPPEWRGRLGFTDVYKVKAVASG